jgi:hypothetical protein
LSPHGVGRPFFLAFACLDPSSNVEDRYDFMTGTRVARLCLSREHDDS